MSPRGVPTDVPPSGSASGRLALRRQLDRLAEVEAWPVYAELCAEAERRILAGGGRVAEHGWGEYSANGDPRKRRTAATG